MKTSGLVILLAEDDPNDQQMFMLALEAGGITVSVHTVISGAEAVRYLEGKDLYADRVRFPFPSMLVTDLKMPGGSGFHVLEYLRCHPEFSLVPTIVLSASADQDDVTRSYRLGAQAYLKKPTSFDDFSRIIKHLFQFWLDCEVPEVDFNGRIFPSDSTGKLGEKFAR